MVQHATDTISEISSRYSRYSHRKIQGRYKCKYFSLVFSIESQSLPL